MPKTTALSTQGDAAAEPSRRTNLVIEFPRGNRTNECTGGISLLSRQTKPIAIEILNLHKQFGFTRIYVTHDRLETDMLASRRQTARGTAEIVQSQMMLNNAPCDSLHLRSHNGIIFIRIRFQKAKDLPISVQIPYCRKSEGSHVEVEAGSGSPRIFDER